MITIITMIIAVVFMVITVALQIKESNYDFVFSLIATILSLTSLGLLVYEKDINHAIFWSFNSLIWIFTTILTYNTNK
jgi:hypothetical protein